MQQPRMAVAAALSIISLTACRGYQFLVETTENGMTELIERMITSFNSTDHRM
jgi:hypothetical protein